MRKQQAVAILRIPSLTASSLFHPDEIPLRRSFRFEPRLAFLFCSLRLLFFFIWEGPLDDWAYKDEGGR